MFALIGKTNLIAALLATLQFLAFAHATRVPPFTPHTLTAQCGAFGPLFDSPWGTMERHCIPGQMWKCEVKDRTGCDAGDASGVSSFTIVDSIDRRDLAGGAAQISITGACTENTMIKCVLRLRDKTLGEKYSMTFRPLD